MSYTVKEWSEIAHFPVCPVKALEEHLVEKEILTKDIEKVMVLVENLKIHEHELRVLRQEIERKLRQKINEQYGSDLSIL